MSSWDPSAGLAEFAPADASGLVRSLADRVALRLSEEIEARRIADDDASASETVPLERDLLEQELLGIGGSNLVRGLRERGAASCRGDDEKLARARDHCR